MTKTAALLTAALLLLSAPLQGVGTGAAHLDFTVYLIDGENGEELTRFSGKRTWAWGGATGAAMGIEGIEHNVVYELALYLKRYNKDLAAGAPAADFNQYHVQKRTPK